MALVRLMGFLGLLLLFPMHVFGLTYRINQSAGESYHVPTPSGSASLVFPEPKRGRGLRGHRALRPVFSGYRQIPRACKLRDACPEPGQRQFRRSNLPAEASRAQLPLSFVESLGRARLAEPNVGKPVCPGNAARNDCLRLGEDSF